MHRLNSNTTGVSGGQLGRRLRSPGLRDARLGGRSPPRRLQRPLRGLGLPACRPPRSSLAGLGAADRRRQCQKAVRMAVPAALILRESPSMKKAVSLINEIDIGRFPRLLTRILQKLHLKTESSFSEEEEEKLQAAFSLEKQDLHLVLETISFILEQAVYHNVKPAALQQQLENIHLRQDKAEAFVNTWSTMGQETVEKFRQRILAPYKLETVGWQLNLQMAHSAQAKLKSPQAVLQLGVNNEDSKFLSCP
nr:COMM domain-containing protein 10 isoform X2 [Saimiri boliviensis boliviensis]